ncbi:MAG: hypothetical protein WCA24_10185 [Thiomonas sp.]
MREDDKNAYLLGFASTQQKFPEREEALPIDPDRAQIPLTGLMVDAGTDLSGTMAADRRVRILPLTIQWPGRSLLDKGTAEIRTVSRQLSHERIRSAEVSAPSVEALSYRMHPHLALNFDRLLLLVTHPALVDASRSVEQMLQNHQEEITHLRRERQLPPDYALKVVDSRSLLSGPALQARLLLNTPEMRTGDVAGLSRFANTLAEQTEVWLAPGHPGDIALTLGRLEHPDLAPWVQACSTRLTQIMHRYPVLSCKAGRFGLEARTNKWKTAASRVIDAAAQAIQNGELADPVIQLSYDGSIRELRDWPEMQSLKKIAAEHEVKLHVTHMSLGGRVWASAQSLSLALIRKTRD